MIRYISAVLVLLPGVTLGQEIPTLSCGPGVFVFLLAGLVLLGLVLLGHYLLRTRTGERADGSVPSTLEALSGLVLIVLPIVIGLVLNNAAPHLLRHCVPHEDKLSEIATTTYTDRATVPGCYVGYRDGRTGRMSYSDPFPTCAACQDFITRYREEFPNTEVIVPCYMVERRGDNLVEITEIVPPPPPSSASRPSDDRHNDDTPGDSSEAPRDTTPPVLQVLGDDPATVYVGATYLDEGAVAVDDRDGDLSSAIVRTGVPVPTVAEGYATITYTVRDRAGNTARASRRVIIVDRPVTGGTDTPAPVPRPDITSPKIVIVGNKDVYLWVGQVYTDAGAQAIDDRDGTITDRIEVSGLPIRTDRVGTQTITYTVQDGAGNRAVATRTVHIAEAAVDDTTDLSYVLSCVGRGLTEACARADLNGDGTITKEDGYHLLDEGIALEQNGDIRVALNIGTPVHSCFFKSDTATPPTCAKDVYPNVIVTTEYLYVTLASVFEDNAATGFEEAVVLAGLDASLSGSPIDRIAYATIAQYDLNRDGIADFSSNENTDLPVIEACFYKAITPACAHTDINRDGYVDQWDLLFIDALTGSLLPTTFSISLFDDVTFQRERYTDAAIVKHCAEAGRSEEACAFADINADGIVDLSDWEAFQARSAVLDINRDGIIDGEINAFDPYDF